VGGADLIRKSGMCGFKQFVEARRAGRLNVSPARKGWDTEVNPERRRCGTLPTHNLAQ
jgi:hypothetical protein